MSRTPRPYIAIGFASTHDALDAESLLGDLGVEVVPIPTPAAISAGCGIALRLMPADEGRAMRYLENAGIGVRARLEIEDV